MIMAIKEVILVSFNYNPYCPSKQFHTDPHAINLHSPVRELITCPLGSGKNKLRYYIVEWIGFWVPKPNQQIA